MTGGLLDDLMVANFGDHLFLVVNAACKAEDEAHLRKHLSDACVIEPLADRALIALQGPKAESVLAKHADGVTGMTFMDAGPRKVMGFDCFVSRSGYTGEDGFEISVPAKDAEALAGALLDDPAVLPIGLGARDSLRLEAGLCLYGHDIDTDHDAGRGQPQLVDPEEPPQRRRTAPADFPAQTIILKQLDAGAPRKRVGIKADGRAPVREHAPLFADETSREPIGTVTSGGFGPSVNGPVAMGYVPSSHAANGTQLFAEVRGQRLAVRRRGPSLLTPWLQALRIFR